MMVFRVEGGEGYFVVCARKWNIMKIKKRNEQSKKSISMLAIHSILQMNEKLFFINSRLIMHLIICVIVLREVFY